MVWATAIKAIGLTAFVLRFLTSGIWGALFVVGLAYFFLPKITDLEAFSVDKLIIWISSLEEESIVGIGTAVLTVFGFLVAFRVASLSWKEQAVWNVRFEVFKELNSIFPELLTIANALKIYADQIIKFHDSQLDMQEADKRFWVKYIGDQVEKYRLQEQQFHALVMRAYQFQGQYGLVLMTLPNGGKNIDILVDRMSEISDALPVYIPVVDVNSPDCVQVFLWRLKIAEIRKLSATVKSAYKEGAAVMGFLSSSCLASVIQLNHHAVQHILFRIPDLGKYFDLYRKSLKTHKTTEGG